jgi:Kef-type K+ transport system membrane component KefB
MPDEINHSIDSLWLVLSIQFGYPGAIIVAVALLTAGPLRRAGKLAPREAGLAVVVGIALFLTFFMGFTVHMWGTSWVLSGLLLGLKAQLTEFSYLANVASEDDRLGQQKRDEIKLNRFGIPKSARF